MYAHGIVYRQYDMFLRMAWTKTGREKDEDSRKRGTQAMQAPCSREACELAGMTRAQQARPLSARIHTRAYGENIGCQRYHAYIHHHTLQYSAYKTVHTVGSLHIKSSNRASSYTFVSRTNGIGRVRCDTSPQIIVTARRSRQAHTQHSSAYLDCV